jgi:hypothetical protein
MKLKTLIPALALLLAPSWTLAAAVTYPGPAAVNDAGATVSPTSITVASVTDLDGNAVATPGAVGHVAGPNTSVVYDAVAKGEAWVTLTPVLSGSTFVNNPPRIFCSTDSSTGATTLLSLATYQSALTTGSTTTVLNTPLTGTADLTGNKVVFTTGVNKGVTRTISSMNTGTGAITLLTALATTPGSTDSFSVVQGSKALEQFLAALGTDSKVILSANAQTGVTIPTVTSLTNPATVTGTVALAAGDETKIGTIGADTGGTTTLLTRLGTPVGSSLDADILSRASSTTAPAWYTPITLPSDYLSSGEITKLTAASTAQQAGSAVTLPGTVLSSADLTALASAVSGIQTETTGGAETLIQTLRLLRAVLAGNSAVTGSSVTFKRKDGTTAALTITNDTLGNRTGSTPGPLAP